MASFLTSWLREAQGQDPQAVWGAAEARIARMDAAGQSEPVGLPADRFSSFQAYQTMTYTKGSLFLRALRDTLGEETFRRGLREYYQRFKFRQVTGADFRAVMEAVSGQDLEGFFHQWLYTAPTGGR
jgi:aminopeptidase N